VKLLSQTSGVMKALVIKVELTRMTTLARELKNNAFSASQLSIFGHLSGKSFQLAIAAIYWRKWLEVGFNRKLLLMFFAGDAIMRAST
jgi:hypothetical protein